MHGFRPKGLTGRDVSTDLWKNTLSQIPSLYGRLVYLAGLRNPNSGAYRHHGLRLLFGRVETDAALRRSHTEAFAEWLSFSLEQQKADLEIYLAELTEPKTVVIASWLRSAPYRNLVPHTANSTERQLFLGDLETLLSLMKNELGVSDPD